MSSVSSHSKTATATNIIDSNEVDYLDRIPTANDNSKPTNANEDDVVLDISDHGDGRLLGEFPDCMLARED